MSFITAKIKILFTVYLNFVFRPAKKPLSKAKHKTPARNHVAITKCTNTVTKRHFSCSKLRRVFLEIDNKWKTHRNLISTFWSYSDHQRTSAITKSGLKLKKNEGRFFFACITRSSKNTIYFSGLSDLKYFTPIYYGFTCTKSNL